MWSVARHLRRSVLLGLALAGLLAVPAQAQAQVDITTRGVLQGPATSVVAGPDGALWHTSNGKQARVGRTTLLGQTTEQVLEDADPGAIIRGPDDTLWFADAEGAIGRVALDGTVGTVADVDAGRPTNLAVGTDGNVWVTIATKGEDDGGAIGRLTPAGELTVFDAGLTADPYDIASGWDGALWFTEPGADRVGRITAAGTVTEFPAAGRPTSLATAFDGAVWFTAADGAIGRIALDGTVTSFATDKKVKPNDIALGADAALWFTYKRGVGRITTTGAQTTYATRDLRPGAITLGRDGALWFTDARHAALGRISLAATAAPVAPPVIGRTVVASATAGRVAVRTPGAQGFQPVTTRTSVPVGSVVDARHGRVRLRTATRSGTQTGTFFGGRFKVRQARKGSGIVRIALRGRLHCRRGSAATISRKRKKRRKIWGLDLGGLFSTLGLDSVTTVRGTRWLTEDRCGGTLTRVVEGSVVVRERATGKRFILHAGERHLARHRR
jgi:virginiamycin B lyase